MVRIGTLPEQALLKRLLNYNPETGEFIWLPRGYPHKKWDVRYAGKSAGCISKLGYLIINIDSQHYFGHRIAWKYMTGADPIEEIDHQNGDSLDNRWGNLREATRTTNARNVRRGRPKHQLPRGVNRVRAKVPSFVACIVIDKKRKHLGCFKTPEEAHVAYVVAAIANFGEFARTS